MAKRQLLLQPYKPDVAERLGAAAAAVPGTTGRGGQYSDVDIGKAMKYSGDAMVECADGDEIVGFVTSVNVASNDGFSVGSVRKEGRVQAIDEAGTLSVGDIVVAGTAIGVGTAGKANVKVATTAADVVFPWVVIAVYGDAADTVLLERV